MDSVTSYESLGSMVNVGFLLLTAVALFMARNSANYRLLFSGLFLIKLIFLCVDAFIREWGVLYYAAISAFDVAALFFIGHRAKVALWLSRVQAASIRRYAKDCVDNFRMSRSELILYVLYLSSLIVNLASVIEWLIYLWTPFSPAIVYELYPLAKSLLACGMFLLIFRMAAGFARGIVSREPIL